MRTTHRPRTLRRLLFLVTTVGALGFTAAPASAAGYCVYVYPQPTYGVDVCIPWGG